MISTSEIAKGLHPGLFLQRELNKKNLKSGHLARSIGEHPQTLSAIIRGRRAMNTPLSLRLEKALGLNEGLLMTLQIHYEISEEKKRIENLKKPNPSKFRNTLFWDTSFDRINFNAHKQFVINRVFERGTDEEIAEIINFYGKETILSTINISPTNPFADLLKEKLKIFLDYEE